MSFINASISRGHVLSESTECLQPDRVTPTNGGLLEKGSVELKWTKADGHTLLVIIPELECTILVEKEEYLRYKCRYETRFVVGNFGGFDPIEDLPAEAVNPYVDMALWMARHHAAAAIRDAGLPTFAFTKPVSARQIIEGTDPDVQQISKTTTGGAAALPSPRGNAARKVAVKKVAAKKAAPKKAAQ